MVGLVTFSARKMPRSGTTHVIQILERKDAKLAGRALIVINVSYYVRCVVFTFRIRTTTNRVHMKLIFFTRHKQVI